jgi:phospholipase D1/2
MHPAPVPHVYDWNSPEDLAVQDPLSDAFQELWIGTGRSNRAAFEKVFRPVPNDDIKTWKDYQAYLMPNAGISVSRFGLFC